MIRHLLGRDGTRWGFGTILITGALALATLLIVYWLLTWVLYFLVPLAIVTAIVYFLRRRRRLQ